MERGVEIHLADRMPTDKMEMSLLGTGQDASDPGNGIYYKTATGLPWGIMFMEPFEWPIERIEITEAFHHFVEWAESGGQLYQDWYKDEPGYRDNSKIWYAD
nr:DUF4842 domain-containing protein [Bacteroidota bacterium]